MNKKPSILIVDDESFYTEVLDNLLREEYDINIVSNGTDALAKAVELPQPDLILLDIMMEDMDGYEVCKHLKQDLATKEIPVIFLTVKSDVDDEVLGFNLGAVDYITKPMSPPIVRARVRTHIEIIQLRKKLEQMILAR
ncbi:MAG: response regulator [Gammaproteobacteria bacterium]|mgnify:FL=1|jgi:putative two-component system response regulator|nr:response regulator [Gammaproteobacteria bacterium]MBT3722520.1 response regulator [Gammaproteobacteria bacterium]MBT4196768.1 response regulator [Gammaproteobacteria bacterium]MBT4450822.1 response regulator [Gammaproteobacteria bacterium]MBT4859837.1 response regulator [Gammaproteobacteria bacterium]